MPGRNDYNDDSDSASGYIFIHVSSPPPRQFVITGTPKMSNFSRLQLG